LRVELTEVVEASQIELLELLAKKRIPEKLRERYFDVMLLWLCHIAGMSVKEHGSDCNG